MTDPVLIPIHGCPRPGAGIVRWGGPPSKHGDSWPRYYCECPSCGRPYEWCGAHWESGMHHDCAPCCGWPFWSPDEADEVYHLDGRPAGYGRPRR